VAEDPELAHALEVIDSGLFAHGDRQLFAPLTGNLRGHDPYLVCADYRAYLECQERAGTAFLDTPRWTRMSILNSARVGRFSSDRAIREYAADIWHVAPVPVAG
jgi:starch phosphorylase